MDGKIETRKSLLNQYNIYDANIIFASVAKIFPDRKRTIQCVKLKANRVQKATQSKLKCVWWCIFMANIKTAFLSLFRSVVLLLEDDSFFRIHFGFSKSLTMHK